MADATPDPTVLAVHIDTLRGDIVQIKEAICAMAEAMQKLAVVEDRQIATMENQQKLEDRLEKLDDRLRAVEVNEPLQSQVSRWVMRAMWGAASAAVAYAAAKIGFAS